VIASVSGRYYAMDRDKRWERIERAFNAMVLGTGEKTTDPIAAVKKSYERGITDEFIEPITIVDERSEPVGLIRDGDACMFYNYRADRTKEMTMALTDPALEKPSRSQVPKNLHFRHHDAVRQDLHIAVRPSAGASFEHPGQCNGAVQLEEPAVAETEKYAHVTYFFNGGNEKPYPGEEREMVASPKVATYDLKPEMSAFGVAEVVERGINDGDFDLIVMNFANADMVGHSGKLDPTVRAVEAVDACLARVYQTISAEGWLVDHYGRITEMRRP